MSETAKDCKLRELEADNALLRELARAVHDAIFVSNAYNLLGFADEAVDNALAALDAAGVMERAE